MNRYVEASHGGLVPACLVACFATTGTSVGKLLNSPNREAVEAIAVVRGIHVRTKEAQVEAVG